MARLLKLLGNDIVTAHSGPEAIVAAREHRPEFVLLDIGLPGMDGYEVASRLRQEDCLQGGHDRRRDGLRPGTKNRASFQGSGNRPPTLVKPVDPDALVALLF